MKVVLLHGPAIASSRKKLSDIKSKFAENDVLVFEKETDLSEILTHLQSQSLFGDERLVILENPPENFTDYTLYSIPHTLVFWFDHEIDPKNWKDAEILFFPEEKELSVFPFLDFLGQRDKRAFLELDKLKKEYDSQYLITMILYLLRNLVVTPKAAKDFVRRKNDKMRANFSTDELIDLYKSVLETDFKIKSGLADEAQAQFLLVNLFLH